MPSKTKEVIQKKRPYITAPRGIVLNVTLTHNVFDRISKMKHAKGLNYEQDIMRLAAIDYLERNGF